MKKTGNQLEFISWIKRDGSGTETPDAKHISLLQDEEFEIICLSLTEKTFIASGFNSFVVKLKNIPPVEIKLPLKYEETEAMAKEFEASKDNGTATLMQAYCAGAKAMYEKIYEALNFKPNKS